MTENVYLFVPNIIGYARVVLAIISFYYMPTNYVAAVWCYMISGLLDAFDGVAARALNQCSRLGSMLDMLTDRAATMCLLVTLSYFYPTYMFWFQISMTIDIVSHWLHMQSALMKGADSHKKIDLEGNFILRHYYTNRKILFCMCAGNEMFYSMLYLCHFTYGPVVAGLGVWQWLCILSFPVAVVKSIISLVQLAAAAMNVVAIDVSEREAAAAQKSQ